MTNTTQVVVPETAPFIIKVFDGKIRFMFDDHKNLTEIVVLSPDGSASLVITAIANNIDAVFVPFTELTK